MNGVRCPGCQQAKGLWEEVTFQGWRSLDENGKPVVSRRKGRDYDVDDWDDADPTGVVGCAECRWQGFRSDLIHLGWDGRPLPRVHPSQLEIAT